MLEDMDRSVGRLLEKLAEHQLDEKTLVLVSGKFSDRFLFAWRVCLTA